MGWESEWKKEKHNKWEEGTGEGQSCFHTQRAGPAMKMMDNSLPSFSDDNNTPYSFMSAFLCHTCGNIFHLNYCPHSASPPYSLSISPFSVWDFSPIERNKMRYPHLKKVTKMIAYTQANFTEYFLCLLATDFKTANRNIFKCEDEFYFLRHTILVVFFLKIYGMYKILKLKLFLCFYLLFLPPSSSCNRGRGASFLTSLSFWSVSPTGLPSFGFLQVFGVAEAVWLTAGRHKNNHSGFKSVTGV